MFGRVPSTHMLALCDSLTVLSPALSCSHHRIGSVGVRGVIKQGTNVMNKQRIQKLSNFLLVREVQCTIEWYPEEPRVSLNEGEGSFFTRNGNLPHSLEMHWSNFDHMPNLFTLQNPITSSPSHSSNVQQLGTVDHMVILYIQ